MHARSFARGALAAALSAASTSAALAGGGHGAGGAVFRPAGGFHGGFGGGFRGTGRVGGPRGLPPISGVIHERAGARPYVSAYGHTGTALRYGGFGRGIGGGYGRAGTAPQSYHPYAAGYGHLGTGYRPAYGAAGFGAYRRAAAIGEGRRRFAARGGFVGGGFGGIGGFGGLGYGYGAGTYGAPGIYGNAGVYGGQGAYGNPGTYGQAGTYGGAGTTATQSVYGNGGGVPYRSEVPLAARFAEPPLGPSPYAPFSPDDRYAYAASADVRPAARVLRVHHVARASCLCGSGSGPAILPYGIGTAY